MLSTVRSSFNHEFPLKGNTLAEYYRGSIFQGVLYALVVGMQDDILLHIGHSPPCFSRLHRRSDWCVSHSCLEAQMWNCPPSVTYWMAQLNEQTLAPLRFMWLTHSHNVLSDDESNNHLRIVLSMFLKPTTQLPLRFIYAYEPVQAAVVCSAQEVLLEMGCQFHNSK